MVSAGTAFVFLVCYMICLLASKVSKRPFYKRMWGVAASILGVSIFITAVFYTVQIAMIWLAL